MRQETADALLEDARRDAGASSASDKKPWPRAERLRALVRQGDRVLDVACGDGGAYAPFKDAAVEYVGVDGSEDLVRRARERVRDMLAEFRVATMLALPFEDGAFDVVFAVDALGRVPSRAYRLRALAEARRALRPGGRLVATGWDAFAPSRFGAVAFAAAAHLLGGGTFDPGDVIVRDAAGRRRYAHAFTLGGLARLCRDAGFVVQEASRADGDLIVVCAKPDPRPVS